MSVLLVFDPYGLDTASALIANVGNLQSLREQIDHHLRSGQEDDLRIHLKSEYRPRFADFIGLRGVQCLEIEPRCEFAKRFGFGAPHWAKEADLAKLLACPTPRQPPLNLSTEAVDETARILALVSPDLLEPENWETFCNGLSEPLLAELGWLNVEAVSDCIKKSALRFLPAPASAWFVERLKSLGTPSKALAYLSCQRLYEHLRSFIQRHGLAYSLPARQEPAEHLCALPIWPIPEAEADEKLVSDWLSVLNAAVHKIEAGSLPSQTLAELAIVHWPRFFDGLKGHLEECQSLAHVELAEALSKLGDDSATLLAGAIQRQLLACERLAESADMEAARQWFGRYLEYASRRFIAGQEPDEAVSVSFSNWVLHQQARISRSDMDWRRVAGLIRQYLSAAQDTRVIVCMVDALSALHMDELREALNTHANTDHAVIDEKILIAPYPSLTEIGKNAVLTGKPADQTSGDPENRLWQAFQAVLPSRDTIHVVKSWESRNQPIPEQARLVVYLENRIDERLHNSVDYKKHQEEVKTILIQLAKDIKRWNTLAIKHGFEPVVIVTADHGITFMREVYSGFDDPVGVCRERYIMYSSPPRQRGGFTAIEICGKYYSIPFGRVRLQDGTPLSHGGLTPEELLIPCLVMQGSSAATSFALPIISVRLSKSKAIPTSDGWRLNLLLETIEPANGIRIEAKAPFRGKAGPYGPTSKNDRLDIELNIQADLPQEGMIRMEVMCSFVRKDTNTEKLFFTLEPLFPPSLLEISDEMTNFENMF